MNAPILKRTVRAMDRLTEIVDGRQCTIVSDDKCVEYRYGDDIDKLAAYEDTGLSPEEVALMKEKLSDNRLIELPCCLGDKVFQVKNGVIVAAYVDGIRFGNKRCCNNEEKYITLRDVYTNYSEKVSFSRFNQFCFATEEEAKRKLERIKQNANSV